jgi:hypothetical protein
MSWVNWKALMKQLSAVIVMALLGAPAQFADAHSWYSGTKDPLTGSNCCGGSDCSPIPASWVKYERDGFRLTLTLDQVRAVNPFATLPVDAFIPPERVQHSPDMNFHVCLYTANRNAPRKGVICFFAPLVS